MTLEYLKLALGFVLVAAVVGMGVFVSHVDQTRIAAVVEISEPLAVLAGAFAVWAFSPSRTADAALSKTDKQAAPAVTSIAQRD